MDKVSWSFSHEIMHEIYERQQLERKEKRKKEECSLNNTDPLLNEQEAYTSEFWHYTSLNSVLSIFEDYDNDFDTNVSKCSMYASNIRFMNDAREYDEGVSSYKDLVKRKLDGFDCTDDQRKRVEEVVGDNIYTISLCEEGDLLSQWKWYGKNSGVSVCFDIEHIQYSTYTEKIKDKEKGKEKSKDSTLPPIYDRQTRPLKLLYSQNDKEQYFMSLMKKYFNKDGDALINIMSSVYIPFCKDEAFKEEKEYRLAFFLADDLPKLKGNETRFNLMYNKAEEGRTKPTLKVNMAYFDIENGPFVKKTKKGNIITKMVVGPGINQEMVFNCLIHAFDRKNYRYHSEEDDKSALEKERRTGRRVEESFLKSKSDHRVHIVKCNDGIKRECYKCENGIIIMKSTAPFRA